MTIKVVERSAPHRTPSEWRLQHDCPAGTLHDFHVGLGNGSATIVHDACGETVRVQVQVRRHSNGQDFVYGETP